MGYLFSIQINNWHFTTFSRKVSQSPLMVPTKLLDCNGIEIRLSSWTEISMNKTQNGLQDYSLDLYLWIMRFISCNTLSEGLEFRETYTYLLSCQKWVPLKMYHCCYFKRTREEQRTSLNIKYYLSICICFEGPYQWVPRQNVKVIYVFLYYYWH